MGSNVDGLRPNSPWCGCGVCDQVFASIYLFDLHRWGGKCLDPLDLGLQLFRGMVWANPEYQAVLDRADKMREGKKTC